jgi:hypothetical protein
MDASTRNTGVTEERGEGHRRCPVKEIKAFEITD